MCWTTISDWGLSVKQGHIYEILCDAPYVKEITAKEKSLNSDHEKGKYLEPRITRREVCF